MDNWKKVYLKDICHKITDGTHKTPRYVETGIVFLSAKNVKNGLLNLTNHKFITLKEHQQLIKRCKPEAGDIMLSKSGSLGDAVLVPELPFDFSIFESLALIKPKRNAIIPLYLKQYLNSPLSRQYFWSITSGIAVKHLHLIDLKRMPIFLPPIEIQNSVVKFLKIWDTAIEKIEGLIATKERQFNWLMHYLMVKSNKNWSISILKNIAQIKKGQQINRDTLNELETYPVWNGGITPSGYTSQYKLNTLDSRNKKGSQKLSVLQHKKSVF